MLRGVVLGAVIALGAMGEAMYPTWDKLPKSEELPDALTMFCGSPVKTAEDWNQKRRPELVTLVQKYMYGFAPESSGITWKKEVEDTPVYGGKGVLRQIVFTINGLPEEAPKIHLAIFLPAEHKGPVPVFLAINRRGNWRLSPETAVVFDPNHFNDKECEDKVTGCRGGEAELWAIDMFLERGYAFATFNETDFRQDEPETEISIQKFFKLPQPEEEQWATIRCWAWGFSRCIDYLVQDGDIDAKRIAVTGHSRRGKTALLAAAMDTRIALANPHQSGTGGTALSRFNNQETVERINRNFPHWFNGVFKNFKDNEAQIPFDQHLLEALVAPRALIDTQGEQDKWANGTMALKGLQAADKVWKLLGAPGAKGNGDLRGGAAITKENTGNLVQYWLDTKHQVDRRYFEKVLDFADMVYGR